MEGGQIDYYFSILDRLITWKKLVVSQGTYWSISFETLLLSAARVYRKVVSNFFILRSFQLIFFLSPTLNLDCQWPSSTVYIFMQTGLNELKYAQIITKIKFFTQFVINFYQLLWLGKIFLVVLLKFWLVCPLNHLISK